LRATRRRDWRNGQAASPGSAHCGRSRRARSQTMRGIGAETARVLHRSGANVVLSGRRAGALRDVAESLDNTASSARIVAGDISAAGTAEAVVAEATTYFGGVDILVNAAGIFAPKPFTEHTAADYDGYMDTIARGTFLASQAVVPSMTERGGGSIVNVGSMWALQAVGATPSSAYSAAMAERHALTRNLAIELGAVNIRVNAVAPAVVQTPVYETFIPRDCDPRGARRFRRNPSARPDRTTDRRGQRHSVPRE
jgi:NAD(P)-dependent dehydrogenase (short-subunit alcohol dehydrogenase family)